jgi:hypothetical protein
LEPTIILEKDVEAVEVEQECQACDASDTSKDGCRAGTAGKQSGKANDKRANEDDGKKPRLEAGMSRAVADGVGDESARNCERAGPRRPD